MNKKIFIIPVLVLFFATSVFANTYNCTSYNDTIDNVTYNYNNCVSSPSTDIGIIIGILGVIFAIMYFSFNLKEEHFLLRTVLTFFSVFLLAVIPYYILNINDITTTNIFYKIIMWFIGIFVAYVMIYFIWYVLQKFKEVTKRG